MNNHTTDRTIYVLAAIPVLLFVISIWYEVHANPEQQRPQIFEPPTISADQNFRPGDLRATGEATVHMNRAARVLPVPRPLAAPAQNDPGRGAFDVWAKFGKFIAEETEKWGKVVKFAGIKAE